MTAPDSQRDDVSSKQTPRERVLAISALALWIVAAVILTAITIGNLAMFALLAVSALLALAGAWMVFSGRKGRLLAGWLMVGAGCIGAMTVILRRDIATPFKGAAIAAIAAIAIYFILIARFARKRPHHLADPTAAASDDSPKSARIESQPPEKPWILVNPKSGGGRAVKAGLVEKARSLGIEVHETQPGEDFVALAEEAVSRGADALGICGGDGSLGTVASVAIKHDLPFVCIAGGTRCHFALDVGLGKDDPLAGLEAFTDGVERQIDVATIGDRVFLNNASFGLYASMVAEPGYRENKVDTARQVIGDLLDGSRSLDALHFDSPDGVHFDEAAVILIGVNEYETVRLAELGTRDRLDGGILQINVLGQIRGTGAELLLSAVGLGSVARSEGASESWKQWTAESIEITADQAPVTVGVDGEFEEHDSPVVLKIHPRALRIRLPRAVIEGGARAKLPTPAELWRAATGSSPDD